MTAAVAVGSHLSEDEYRVLSRFAARQTLRQIASETGATLADVRALVWDVAENNQTRAKALVEEYDKANPSAASVQPTEDAQVEDVAGLLDTARETGDAELAGRADHIISLICGLRAMLQEHTMRAEARAALIDEARRLEDRLAEIRTQLDTLGGAA